LARGPQHPLFSARALEANDCDPRDFCRRVTANRSHSTEARTAPTAHHSQETTKGSSNMALSDPLTKLAARAKDLEDRAAAAKAKGKADLEQEVKEARDSAQEQADSLRKSAESRKGEISAWWDRVQQSWNENIASIRRAVDEGRAEHDAKSAQRAAERADEDAAFAIDYAYAAIEEAEYAVLDADLAHMRADEVAGKSGASS
jgi:chemotaxis protein histidine kinase CheA